MIGLRLTTDFSEVSDSRLIIIFLMSIVLTFIFNEIYPFIRVVIMKKKYNAQEAKKMALWNAITVWLIIYIITIIIFEDALDQPTTGLGIPAAYLYYLINKKVWISKGDNKDKSVVQKKQKKEKKKKTDEKNNSNNDKFVCSACGALVKEDATKCPTCGETFDDNDEEKDDNENKIDFDKKENDLRKLKQLLDDKIITKAEFDIEKKKILKN